MDKLKNILFNFTNSNPDYSFTPSQISAIQDNLLRTFSSPNTPTHPTYSLMISEAIEELIEEGNSTTEEMISERIVMNYEGSLPWAHERFVKHHLDQMYLDGELDYESDGCYYKRSRKRLRRRFVSDEEDNVVEEELNEFCDDEDVVSEELGRRKQKRKRTRCVVLDDQDEDENEAVVTEGGNAEACDGVLQFENREDERKSGEFVVGELEVKKDVVHSEDGENAAKKLHVAAPLSNTETIEAGGTAVEKSVLKGTKPNPCDNELTILPCMRNLEDSAVGKKIVPLSKSNDTVICCLPCVQPETPKKKGWKNRERRTSKSAPEKAKALDSSDKRSRETKLKRKSQSAKLKGVTLLEDGPTKLPEKLETTTDPSLLESDSLDDDNKTITQLFQKCSNRKKHGTQVAALKDASALASSKTSNQSLVELPSLETSVEMTPTVEKKLAMTKGAEEHIPVQLSLRDNSCDNVEVATVKKSSSRLLEEKGTNSSEGPDNPQPTFSNSTASCEPDFVNVNHQVKQPQLFSDSQCALDGGVSESIVGGPKVQCLEEPSKPMETTNGFTTPSSLVELDQQDVGPSELPDSQIVIEGPKVQCLEERSKPMETADGFTTPSLLVELHQQEVGPSGSNVQGLEEPLNSKHTTDGLITQPMLAELHKQEVGPSELTGTQNIVEESEVQCLEEPLKSKQTTDGLITPPLHVELHKQEVGPSGLTCTLNIVEGSEVHFLEHPSKSKEITDGLVTPSMHVELHQQEVGPPESSGSQSMVEGPKVQRLDPSKLKETTDEFISISTPTLPVDIHQQEVGASEPMGPQTTVEGPKEQCLRESSKPKESTDGFITPSMPVELHEQEVEASKSTGSQGIVEVPKIQCLEEPSEAKETTDGLITPSVPVELHQQEVRASESMGSQGFVEVPKVQCLEEPSKSMETTDGLNIPSVSVERHQQEVRASDSMGSQGFIEVPKVQCLEEPSKSMETTDGLNTPSVSVELHQQEVRASESMGSQGFVEVPKVQCLEEPSEFKETKVGLHTPSMPVDGSSDNQHSQVVINKSIGAVLLSQCSEHLVEDDGEQNQHEVRHEVLELPVEKCVDEKFHESDQYPRQPQKDDQEKENKDDSEKQNQDSQERPLKLTEAKPEDEAYLSGFHNRILEGTSKLTSQEHSCQLNEQPEDTQLQKRKPGRPRKSEASPVVGAANSSDPSILHLHKQDGQVRTRQQLANMRDAKNFVDPHPREQEHPSETENPCHLLNENKQQENVGQETTGDSKEVSLNIVDPSCLDLKKQPGPDLVSGPHLEQQNKPPKKGGRGRPRMEKEPSIGSQGRPTEKNENEVEDHSEAMNTPQSQQHNNKRKRGRPPVQEHMNDDDLGSQDRQQANSRKAESLGKGVTKGGAAPSDASTCLIDQSSQQDKAQDQPRRRLTRHSEAAKSILDSQNDRQPEFNLSDQLPPSKPVTRLSKSQQHQGRRSESRGQDKASEKTENLLKLPKEMTAKSAPIHVPLASKDHLRSRMKRQCQDST